MKKVIAFYATVFVCITAQAQNEVPAPPNFNGVWLAAPGTIGGIKFGEMGALQPPLLTPAARQTRDEYNFLTDDPAFSCSQGSVNRVWSNPVPIEIEQLPDRVVFRYEYMDGVRTVFLDQQSQLLDALPRVLGHSIGRYEGSTLIIETAGFSASYIGAVTGTPQTETLRTIERLTMVEDGQRFHLEIRHEDPVTFAEPWTATRDFVLTDLGRLEWDCVLEDAGYEDFVNP